MKVCLKIFQLDIIVPDVLNLFAWNLANFTTNERNKTVQNITSSGLVALKQLNANNIFCFFKIRNVPWR